MPFQQFEISNRNRTTFHSLLRQEVEITLNDVFRTTTLSRALEISV